MNKENKYRLALFLMGVFLVWVLLPKCSSEPKVTTPSHDSIYHYEAIDNNTLNLTLKYAKYLESKNDSLMSRKPIYVIKYKTKFDSLYITDTSCQSSLIMLYNTFGELNDLNDSIIANNNRSKINDSITIATLTHKVGLKQGHITIDSTRLVALIDTLPKVYKQGLRKGRRQGFVAGVLVDETINIAERVMVKP